MHVSEILEAKGGGAVTIKTSSTVGEAVALLAEKGFGALVVSNDGTKVDGILSERDIVRRLAGDTEGLRDTPVSELMTSDVFTCVPEDTAESIMATMTEHHFRHLPVCVDGCLQGVISIGDVVKARLADLEEERRHLEGYIQQGY